MDVLSEDGTSAVRLNSPQDSLCSACWRGDLDFVKTCVDVNLTYGKQYGTLSPLHEAVLGGHLHVVRWLVEEGKANVNIRGGTSRYTPLMEAVSLRFADRLDITRYLVEEAQADVNLRSNSGRTALAIAAYCRRWDAMKILLERPGIDVNQADYRGITPLMITARHCFGDRTALKMLLAAGADLTARDKKGRLACDMCLHYVTKNWLRKKTVSVLSLRAFVVGGTVSHRSVLYRTFFGHTRLFERNLLKIIRHFVC